MTNGKLMVYTTFIMKTLRLDATKIRYELDRLGKNPSWLAAEIGTSRQRVHQILKDGKPIFYAEKFGAIFDLSPDFLLKTEEEM